MVDIVHNINVADTAFQCEPTINQILLVGMIFDDVEIET